MVQNKNYLTWLFGKTKVEFCCWRLLKFLLLEATTFLKSQSAYSRPEAAIFTCGQMLQDLLQHKIHWKKFFHYINNFQGCSNNETRGVGGRGEGGGWNEKFDQLGKFDKLVEISPNKLISKIWLNSTFTWSICVCFIFALIGRIFIWINHLVGQFGWFYS